MVELKKKVTLRAKVTEVPEEVQKPKVALKKKQLEPTPDPPTPPVQPTPPDGGDESNGKWKKYAAVLAGLVVLGGAGYYLSQQGVDEPQSVIAVGGTRQPDETTNDGVSEVNQNEQNQDAETPADAATVENPSSDTPVGEIPAGETPATPNQKSDAAVPASSSTPSSPSVSQPVQDKPKVTPAQSKEAIGASSAIGAVEEEAKEVIRGKYGNGAVRKRNLGDRYAEIQNKVNEMYRNGLVH